MANPASGPPLRWLWADRERRRQAKEYWIVDTLHGLAATTIHYGARALPIDLCSALGAWLGGLSGRYGHRYAAQRARLRENWAYLKPDPVDPMLPNALRDGAWRHVGRTALELSILDRLWAAERITVEGAEHIAAARATGRPVIAMAIHVGNWEVIGVSLVGLGHKVTMIYQPVGNRFCNWD